jgi:hypothetical protein
MVIMIEAVIQSFFFQITKLITKRLIKQIRVKGKKLKLITLE